MKLTVFTPTYNRAHTLIRLFDSLTRQTDTRFEWLIIDDGSTDNTEELINSLLQQPHNFEIRYYKQSHRGKPSAQNLAVDLAKGDLFITCDSNKYLNDKSVEYILDMEKSIRNIPMMCGVGGYRADFSGKIYGGEMLLEDNEYIDCTNLERGEYNLLGDKSTAFYTSILRNYKSPIYPGETFVSEAVWLTPMACDGYKIRWFPKIICFGEYAEDGLTKQGANSYIGHYENFFGFLSYVNVEIKANQNSNINNLIIETIRIAKKKKMSFKELALRLDCTKTYLVFVLLKDKIRYLYFLIHIPKRVIQFFLSRI